MLIFALLTYFSDKLCVSSWNSFSRFACVYSDYRIYSGNKTVNLKIYSDNQAMWYACQWRYRLKYNELIGERILNLFYTIKEGEKKKIISENTRACIGFTRSKPNYRSLELKSIFNMTYHMIYVLYPCLRESILVYLIQKRNATKENIWLWEHRSNIMFHKIFKA